MRPGYDYQHPVLGIGESQGSLGASVRDAQPRHLLPRVAAIRRTPQGHRLCRVREALSTKQGRGGD